MCYPPVVHRFCVGLSLVFVGFELVFGRCLGWLIGRH